jgi:hypothetical protein
MLTSAIQFQECASDFWPDSIESESTMTRTIVAIYDDIAVARQVVEDLVNAEFSRSSISLITNDANNHYSHYLDEDYIPRDDAVTAAEGAGFGAVVGGLTGILAGLAALTIPGIGLVIAAGPILAGLTGIIAGAVTGGIVGALVKSGVPEDEAPYYAEGIRRGGTLVSVETSDTLHAEDIMNRYGSTNIHERINLWRQAGWKGFEPEENGNTDKSNPEMLSTVTTDTTTTRVTHATHGASPAGVTPVEPAVIEEPPPDDEDTAKVLPVKAPVPINDATTPVIPIPDVVTAEPVLLVIEEPFVDDEDTTPDLQNTESATNYPKG